MNLENFGRQVHEVRRNTQLLHHRVSESPEGQQDLLAEAFEELRTALEELHVAEEELRQQNEQLAIAFHQTATERKRYQELFDFAPDGYLVTDAQGKILEANYAAAHLLKISKNFLIGKPLVSFFPSEERRAFRYQLQRLFDMEGMQEWEISIQPRQGDIFDASLTVKTIRDNEGKPIGWRWLLRDITSRKQAEEKLNKIQIQNLKLQEVSLFKSQMLAVISHELRTPMNIILGFSQLLLRRYYHLLPPELREMVEKIVQSGKHLLKLIEDILDFCKLETSKLELNLQEVNFVELVTRIVEELKPLAERKNLTLILHSELKNPNIINDRDRLQQAVTNLITNAIKFTETGGVFVEIQQVKGDRLVLMVKDTGIGIPESEVAHIFTEFWQVDKSTTRKQGGVGLGLAIVDKLVRLMKGTITVESKLGEGSTFRVELPMSSEQ
ncbi:sensor histidine kinase [Scytonema sp. NUACC26]|uniref:sensor histidine kinase n=1 Tax=Scytonema sp. NUACC26 TaxID=3140176 RepID=UPI0034DC6F9C